MIKGKYETVVTSQYHITSYRQICVNMTRNHNQLNLKIFNYRSTMKLPIFSVQNHINAKP